MSSAEITGSGRTQHSVSADAIRQRVIHRLMYPDDSKPEAK